MTRQRLTTIILVMLLIGSNLYWVYSLVDQGVTLTYTDASYQLAQANYEQLLVLASADLVGMSADEAINKLGADIHGLDPFIKEGCLYYSQVCLRLDSKNVIEGYGERTL